MAGVETGFGSLINKKVIGKLISDFLGSTGAELQMFVSLAVRVFPRYRNLIAAGKEAEKAFCEAAELEFRATEDAQKKTPKAKQSTLHK